MRIFLALMTAFSLGSAAAATAAGKCSEHVLEVGSAGVATGGALFTVRNTGDKPVLIDPPGIPLAGGAETTFAGDSAFDYHIKLENPADTTTVQVCVLG